MKIIIVLISAILTFATLAETPKTYTKEEQQAINAASKLLKEYKFDWKLKKITYNSEKKLYHLEYETPEDEKEMGERMVVVFKKKKMIARIVGGF